MSRTLEDEVMSSLSAMHIGEGGRVKLQPLGVRHALKGRGSLRECVFFLNKGSLLLFSALFIEEYHRMKVLFLGGFSLH